MQFRDVWKLNMMMTFGSCLFQQMGLVIVVIITTVEWSRGKELQMDTTVANLAVVYVLFNSCNFFMYFGAMTLV